MKVIKFRSSYCILWMLGMELQNLMFLIEFHLCFGLIFPCYSPIVLIHNLFDYIVKVYNVIRDQRKKIFCLFVSEQILRLLKCTRTMATNSLGDGLNTFLAIRWL